MLMGFAHWSPCCNGHEFGYVPCLLTAAATLTASALLVSLGLDGFSHLNNPVGGAPPYNVFIYQSTSSGVI